MRITIKDHFRETEIFLQRVVFAGFVVLVLVLAVIARLAYLQLIEDDHYTTLSQSNRIHLLPVAPNRGLILDRDGIVLAQNFPTFTLSITPERARGVNDTLARLADVIEGGSADWGHALRISRKLTEKESYEICKVTPECSQIPKELWTQTPRIYDPEGLLEKMPIVAN